MQPRQNSESVNLRVASSTSVLKEEIASLLDKANAIDASLLEVRRILVKTHFDPEDDFGEYRKKYIELVWKSRRIAGKAGVACDDFCGDLLDLLLSNAGASKEELAEEFEHVMAGWKDDGERDSQLSHELEELSNTLQGFGTIVAERIARATDEEARLQSEVNRLGAEIVRANLSQSMSYQILAVVSGVCYLIGHSFQRIGIVRTVFAALSLIVSLFLAVICQSFKTANAVLKSCLRGSISAAIREIFLVIDEAFDKLRHLQRQLEEPGGQPSSIHSREDLASQRSALEAKCDEVQLALQKRVDILSGVGAITVAMNSLSSEVTSLNDIFNLLTVESVQIVSVLRSDAQVVDLPAKIVTLRRELSPIGKALAAYSRAQKT